MRSTSWCFFPWKKKSHGPCVQKKMFRLTRPRLEHKASLTARDHRKLTAFGSAADGGYPELWPSESYGSCVTAQMTCDFIGWYVCVELGMLVCFGWYYIYVYGKSWLKRLVFGGDSFQSTFFARCLDVFNMLMYLSSKTHRIWKFSSCYCKSATLGCNHLVVLWNMNRKTWSYDIGAKKIGNEAMFVVRVQDGVAPETPRAKVCTRQLHQVWAASH